jgi:hypothetical protein
VAEGGWSKDGRSQPLDLCEILTRKAPWNNHSAVATARSSFTNFQDEERSSARADMTWASFGMQQHGPPTHGLVERATASSTASDSGRNERGVKDGWGGWR